MAPIDLSITILTSEYGAGIRQLERRLEEVRGGREALFNSEFKEKKVNFNKLVSKLKKDGLIEKKQDKLFITKLGRKRSKEGRTKFPKREYFKEVDSTFKIIIFDIPEKIRSKRGWLRIQLNSIGFKMLQKSVWFGQVKIPEPFLEDLRNMQLLGYVQVFEITKKGSLSEIK